MRLFVLFLLAALTVSSCVHSTSEKSRGSVSSDDNLLEGIPAVSENGMVNALIEIEAGGMEKWELDKQSGTLKRDSIDGHRRTIQYLGYPANYGMIPQTVLPKEQGGDGDPLDIIVLGPSVERGTVLPSVLLGVLQLEDRGEQDDKLIALSHDAPFQNVQSLSQLDSLYPGILGIIETWFVNYKGSGKMQSKGFLDQSEAKRILDLSMKSYEASKATKD